MSSEQAVIVEFQYGLDDLDPLFALEEKLHQAIADADVGEYDGNEIATDLSDGSIYMYGPDADALHATVLPHLAATPFMKGAVCTRRYGDAVNLDAKEVRTVI
jgi:hypothetical protein